MLDEAAIGTPGVSPLSLSLDEQARLAGVVRETFRRRTLSLIERQGAATPDLLECPSCGDRVILLDSPGTFVVRDHMQVCTACGAERDFVQLFRAEADLGGEG